jgi:hypothetical protein
MILEKQTDTIILEEGEVQESTNMVIDQESHVFLMRMLSKFYSDGIGSLIRETASNALDSHRELGITDPIIVSFKQNKDSNYEFSVEDFGMGMDDKDVENVIKKYGKSTKRQSVNQLGAFGLGFKSPLAYTSAFYFIGRKGGMERKWMLYEAEDDQNKIDLLYESSTKERNGVKIIVPVKYGDRYDFEAKIKEQLAYFESVYFDCGTSVRNDFIITRTEDFQWSELNNDRKLHICLDNVYYPIDFPKLGISPINLPVALRFKLTDGLFPVPNREQLKYSPEAKKVILAKLAKVADYFVNKYNSNVKDSDSVFDIFRHYSGATRYVDGISKNSLDVSLLKPYSKIKFIDPELVGLKLLKIKDLLYVKDYLLQEYVIKYTLRNGRFNSENGNKWRQTLYFSAIEDKEVYIFTELSALKKAYLRESKNWDTKSFVKKDISILLGNPYKKVTGSGMQTWMKILSLQSHPKKEWRDRIKECQYIIGLLTKSFIDVDKLDVPETWIEGRKKQKVQAMVAKGTHVRRKKLTGEVTGKMSEPLERFVSGKNCKFVSTVLQMKDAHKAKYFIVYGGTEDEEKFQKYFTVFNKKDVKFVMFSERELKNLKDIELHNWMKMEEFEKGRHKIFKRAITAYLIDQLEEKNHHLFDRKILIKEVSEDLFKKIEKLDNYRLKYFLDGDVELYKSMLLVAEEYNLYDTSIYSTYRNVKNIVEKLTFLNPILGVIPIYNVNENIYKALRDLFKYHNYRIDWQHYKAPIVNEEPVLEIEELEQTI